MNQHSKVTSASHEKTHKTKPCPYCAEEIMADAKKCKHCGEYLDETLRQEQKKLMPAAPLKWKPGVAAVLSLFIPGAGQIYKGQIGNGIVWLICVVIGYMLFIVPGLILHLCCIYGAYSGDPTK